MDARQLAWSDDDELRCPACGGLMDDELPRMTVPTGELSAVECLHLAHKEVERVEAEE